MFLPTLFILAENKVLSTGTRQLNCTSLGNTRIGLFHFEELFIIVSVSTKNQVSRFQKLLIWDISFERADTIEA